MKLWAIRLVCLAVLASMGTAITGCNTIHGMGQDITSTGNAMQNAAE